MAKAQALRERTAEALGGSKVDTEHGVVRDVVLLGLESSNGYSYDEKAVRDAVAGKLYDGVQVFADHVPDDHDGTPRPMRELVGAIESARFEGGKVRGDVHVIQSSRSGAAFLEIAGKPALAKTVGMSHDAIGELSESGPKRVTALSRVVSVDVVTRPATTRGLFESARADGEHDSKLREMAGQRVQVLTAGSATKAGIVVRGPMYEVEIDGEGSYPRLIPAELIEFDEIETKESTMANDKEAADLSVLRERVAAQDAELKTLRDQAALRETADHVAKATAKMPAKVAARIAEKFKGKAAPATEIDAHVADVVAILEEAKASKPAADETTERVVEGAGPVLGKQDADGYGSDAELLTGAFAMFGMTTASGAAKQEG